MKTGNPLPHWNNFTVPELREILEHCVALEKLGISQDEEMIVSIERDITLREKMPTQHAHQKSNYPKTRQHPKQKQYLIEQTA